MQSRSGEIIREYQLMEQSGRGSFAAVYRAEHKYLENSRAVKIIHSHHLNDNDTLQQFIAEARIVDQLRHPYIVGLHEFWKDDRGAYIVMEWMANGSIADYMHQHKRMKPDMVSRCLSQIAPALSLVHSKQIVHHDLKPANILFDENYNAHLGDFGLAQWLTTQTASGDTIEGTPAYHGPQKKLTRQKVSLSQP